MTKRGFTVVELVITVTVMGILLVLAFVNLSSSQEKSRDEERKADVEALAGHLESYYKNGTDSSTVIGRYPSVTIVGSETTLKAALRDLDVKNAIAPGSSGVTSTFTAATNALEAVETVLPSPTGIQYVYQPLSWSGAAWQLCTGVQECRRFNLFYRTESDGVIYKITSKNQ